MTRVYLDNAATTAIAPEVIAEMSHVLSTCYGNPSSIHWYGREARAHIEKARRKVAGLLGCSPSELFFTSGGTEANNMIIRKTIEEMGIGHAISSSIEHHAVSHTLEELAHKGTIALSYVKLDAQGHVDMGDLERLLQNHPGSFVSLMHANNEIGTLIDLEAVGNLVKKYQGIFHSDTVQTMAHYRFNLTALPVDLITCSAHKFHGPKGVGFLYCSSDIHIKPFITGGAQERNMRAGTENIYGIVGLAKALELACEHMELHQEHIRNLKRTMIAALQAKLPGVAFNGDVSENSLYTVLNVSLPPTPDSEMLLMKLDIMGICASGGSACSSGSQIGSHVLAGIQAASDRPAIRFSFSRYTTHEEIERAVEAVVSIYHPKPAMA